MSWPHDLTQSAPDDPHLDKEKQRQDKNERKRSRQLFISHGKNSRDSPIIWHACPDIGERKRQPAILSPPFILFSRAFFYVSFISLSHLTPKRRKKAPFWVLSNPPTAVITRGGLHHRKGAPLTNAKRFRPFFLHSTLRGLRAKIRPKFVPSGALPSGEHVPQLASHRWVSPKRSPRTLVNLRPSRLNPPPPPFFLVPPLRVRWFCAFGVSISGASVLLFPFSCLPRFMLTQLVVY